MGGAVVALAIFLFVLLLITKPVSRWLSWAARNRYEALLSTSFLLLLILLLSPLLLSLVDTAKDLTPRSLFWKLGARHQSRGALAAVGREQVEVRMPLDQISSAGDGDDDAGAQCVRPDLPLRGSTGARRARHGRPGAGSTPAPGRLCP